jgi:putative hydrolase of the HAD superfamily
MTNSSSNNNGRNPGAPIRAVILDFGEVLCFRPKPEHLRRMSDLFRIDQAEFFEIYVSSRGPYDQGLMTAEEYWRAFAQQAGVPIDDGLIEKIRAWDTGMWSQINASLTGWLGQLRAADLTTALLSNMPTDMAAYARKNFAWIADFDHLLLSCEMRLIKPSEEIFKESVRRVGTNAQETLFVDDREENIRAAKAVGLQAIQFRGVAELKAALTKKGFGILPKTPAD